MQDKNRLKSIRICAGLSAVYLTIRVGVPALRSLHLEGMALVLAAIMVMMLVQLALAVCIARLQLQPKYSVMMMFLSAAIFLSLLWVLTKAKLDLPGAMVQGLLGLEQLSLISFAAFAGTTFSFIIRERNLLLPVTMFAGFVDYWNVALGPLGHMISKKPQMLAAVTVELPSPVRGIPGTIIGMGDFVFLGLYFAVLYRFSMNVRGTFWLGYALLTASMFIVLGYGIALPALVPMALAVIVANRRLFHMSREEKLAIVYVGVFFLVLLVGSGIFLILRMHPGKV